MGAINAPVIFSFAVMGAPFVALWLVPFATLVRWTGLLFLAYALMKTLQWTYITFVASNNLNAYRRRDGRAVWALVTGASDGIGKAFAAELLRRGFNVIIVSRTEQKLKAVRDELLAGLKPERQGKVTAEYIVADAERALEAELYDHIVSETKRIVGGGALTVLVNNVGIEVLTMGLLHEQNTQDMNRMLNVNCTFPTKLTALLLPVLIGTEADGKTLLRTGKANKTAIINVSSYSSVVPAPFLSVYAATKSYNSAFSTNTALEYAPYGVDVLCITPSFVASAMTGTASTTIERCSARACAAGSLDKLGAAGWKVSPYWYHAVQEALSKHVYPTKLVETIVYALLKGNAKAHKRRRERQAQAAAEADAKLKAQ